MAINQSTSVVPASGVDVTSLIAAAKRQNELLYATGNTPELPGQTDRIPARDAVGREFVIRSVEIHDSEFKDGAQYALMSVVFVDEPDCERVISAGGGYLVPQLKRTAPEELQSHVWTVRELKELKGKSVPKFQNLYPLVIDYANRPDANLVDADITF